jgi:aminoglycoside phosphotransferase (APT) family kinase protein
MTASPALHADQPAAPDAEVLAQLAVLLPWLREPGLRFAPTHHGLCNTSHEVCRSNGERYVLRACSGDDAVLNIHRAAEARAFAALSASGLGPELLAALPTGHYVTRYIPHERVEVEWLRSPTGVAAVAEALARLQALPGNGKPFDPAADIERRLTCAEQQLSAHPLVGEFLAALAPHRAHARAVANALTKEPQWLPGLVHGDAFPNNFLRTGDRLRVIDLEYTGEGDGLYDVGCLAFSLDATSTEALLTARLGQCNAAILRALRLQQYLAGVWDGGWALVQLIRNRPGHDYPQHLRNLLGYLVDMKQQAEC